MKALTDKTIFCIPGAHQEIIQMFIEKLKDDEKQVIVLNQDMKVFKIIKGEIFEVTNEVKQ